MGEIFPRSVVRDAAISQLLRKAIIGCYRLLERRVSQERLPIPFQRPIEAANLLVGDTEVVVVGGAEVVEPNRLFEVAYRCGIVSRSGQRGANQPMSFRVGADAREPLLQK